MKWMKAAIGIAAVALVVAGCGGKANVNESRNAEPGSTSQPKLKVVATIYPMAEFASQVGGELAEVTTLVPTGIEPHDWEPTPKDVALIQEADIFVYNGGVEQWVDQVLGSTANSNRIVVKATGGITLVEGAGHDHDHGHGDETEGTHEEEHADEHDHEHDHDHEQDHGHDHDHDHEHDHEEEHEHDHDAAAETEQGDSHNHSGELDPHVWLSPALAQQQVLNIQAAFIQADQANEAAYKGNAEQYITQLQQLDQEFKDRLAGAQRQHFVTQHAAFGYLAREYNLTQLSISGLSPDQEPSPARMAELIDLIKDHDINVIFFESLVDPKIAQTIAGETGASTDVLNTLEGLTPADIEQNRTYLSIMRDNLEALVRALAN